MYAAKRTGDPSFSFPLFNCVRSPLRFFLLPVSFLFAPARAASLSLGVAGTLIFGLGMCMVLEWSVVAGGVVVSVLGAAAAACAHPLHTFLLRRGKEKYGDEIIKLSGELLGDDRRDVSRADASDNRSRTDENNDGNDVRGSEE